MSDREYIPAEWRSIAQGTRDECRDGGQRTMNAEVADLLTYAHDLIKEADDRESLADAVFVLISAVTKLAKLVPSEDPDFNMGTATGAYVYATEEVEGE